MIRAFSSFSNKDLMDFFESRGLKLKSERQGRVFPITDSSHSIKEVLEGCLRGAGIEILYNTTLSEIVKKPLFFELYTASGRKICSRKLILSTGGLSFTDSGSKTDGFSLAKSLGHKIIPLKPALVPLVTKEKWVKDLQGLSLKNIRLTFSAGGRRRASGIGELMFTHFGISGPLVLDLSGEITALLSEYKEIRMYIDLKPALGEPTLEARLLREFAKKGSAMVSTVMEELLPKKIVPIFISLSGIVAAKKASQLTQKERRIIMHLLKALPLTIEGALPLKRAMVTGGGVSTKDINPRTMESRILPGVYFAGEIIDGAAPSGGYNLQQAFSTGYLAGEKAAYA